MGGEREKTEQMNGWVRGGVCGTEKNKNASSALIPKTAWCGAHPPPDQSCPHTQTWPKQYDRGSASSCVQFSCADNQNKLSLLINIYALHT